MATKAQLKKIAKLNNISVAEARKILNAKIRTDHKAINILAIKVHHDSNRFDSLAIAGQMEADAPKGMTARQLVTYVTQNSFQDKGMQFAIAQLYFMLVKEGNIVSPKDADPYGIVLEFKEGSDLEGGKFTNIIPLPNEKAFMLAVSIAEDNVNPFVAGGVA